jgi:hypothetical protein
MRLAGYVARLKRKGVNSEFWHEESIEETDY